MQIDQSEDRERRMSPVIDVHTHMLSKEWLALLEKHGKPRYSVKAVAGGLHAIHLEGAPFMTPVPNPRHRRGAPETRCRESR